jgi:hypothetical protein
MRPSQSQSFRILGPRDRVPEWEPLGSRTHTAREWFVDELAIDVLAGLAAVAIVVALALLP